MVAAKRSCSGTRRPATRDVAVIGGGIVGLATALRLAQSGARIILIDAEPPPPSSATVSDGRTTALLRPSVSFLDQLGIWRDVSGRAAPLAALRIVNLQSDDRADADVTFEAREVGQPAFGHNVANDDLRRALFQAVTRTPDVAVRSRTRLAGVEIAGDRARLALDDRTQLEARLIVAADGRNSFVRRAAGISATTRTYGQTAIVCSFAHERPHNDTSIELHRAGGPFTMVPLPGRRSSLVWVEIDARAQELAALDQRAFKHALHRRASPWLGAVTDVSERRSYPIQALLARRLAAPRVVLVGEAAHALSPIGAQGLNLSLRDVDALGELVDRAMIDCRDPGAPELLAGYCRQRMADVRARFFAVDGLNRAVASDLVPIRVARSLGLQALGSIAPLRRRVMRAMMDPIALPAPLARVGL